MKTLKQPVEGTFEFYYEKHLLKGKTYRDDVREAVKEWLTQNPEKTGRELSKDLETS